MFNNRGGLGFGQGGFGGGGYGVNNDSMAPPGGGFLTSPGKSPMSQAEKKKVIQNMMPVTVAQVLMMPDGDEHLKVGSLAAHMVTLVGKVRHVDEQTTRITYKLDDMTGPLLEVQLWMSDNEDTNAENRTKVTENMYVRVLGSVRSLNGQRLVSAFRVLPLLDLNEISMHILEVIHTHMTIVAMDKELTEGKMDTSMTFGAPSAFSSNMNQSQSMDKNLGLNKQQITVYQTIMSVRTEDGISKESLFGYLKTIPRGTIEEHLKFLCNEGHIYTTIDEDHYKTIDSM